MIDHICELCGKPFKAKLRATRFCCKRCSNTHNSRTRKGVKKIPCKRCGKKPAYNRVVCLKCYYTATPQELRQYGITPPKGPLWTQEEIQYLRDNYSCKGATVVAHGLGTKTYKQTLDKASKLKLLLTDEARQRIVHNAAKEYMTNHNPMKRQEVRQKVSRWLKEHPEHIKPLIEAHQRLERSKPSGLEKELRNILNELGVAFEPSFLVKPKFIVDIRIGNLIIQADGDYWHGHPRFEPLTERQKAQQRRDKAQDAYLKKSGYTVVRIWERDMSAEIVRSVLERHSIPLV